MGVHGSYYLGVDRRWVCMVHITLVSIDDGCAWFILPWCG